MAVDPRENLEKFWETLLGRDPEKIRALWKVLEAQEQESVRTHLERMAFEDGWTVSQRLSAHTALEAIKD
ncbi:MAG TPA: hypothetical protein VHP83_21665 [Aggregatilineaceae bacterium]|nr:hypothetical protein [Aggregatilineaceae bacterium]